MSATIDSWRLDALAALFNYPIDPARRLARRTRVAQGLPARVTDAEALERMAGLVCEDVADDREARSIGAQEAAR